MKMMSSYLTQHLHRAARHTPERIATVFRERRQSYASLAARVPVLAGGLRALGLEAGGRVALLAMNSDRYLEVFLAVLWAGGAICPVNTRWNEKEILFSLDDCTPTVLLVDDGFRELGERMRSSAASLRHVVHIGDGAPPPNMMSLDTLLRSEPVADAHRNGSDLAGIFYTGGTTGFPKGVMLSHDSINAAVANRLALGCGPGPIALHVAPLFHLAGLLGLLSELAVGGTHVFIGGFEPTASMAAIEREGVTDMLIVPTMIQMMLDHPERQNFDLGSLRHVVYGGSPISETLLARLMEAVPAVNLMQGYGMTELSGCVTYLPARYHTGAGRQAGMLLSAGYAALMSEVAIVDHEGREVPRGQIGELAARGGTAMLGYWNRPQETADTVRNGWVHSGDMAYMGEEGCIFIVDRLKDMIVCGGENVYSAEVENALSKHAAIAQCAVIGIPSDQWGESVHAVVVLNAGVEAGAEELIAHCKARIAGYKCPRSVEFRLALPLTATGKLEKHTLRAPYWKDGARRVN